MKNWRNDFPILSQTFYDKPLAYLDNSATTQKPQQVIDAICQFYSCHNANVHRGVYALSEQATALYNEGRKTVQQFINAPHDHEIIFTSGTTESINLIAHSFGQQYINTGDEIIISAMEHHSNIVPWQMLCEQKGALLKVIPVKDDGTLDIEQYQKLFNARTKIVALTHVSNVLGTINPVKLMIAMAHAKNVPVLIDGAQAIAHHPVDVQDLDCDFYAFSGHKLYGPSGIGILYGKSEWLDKLPPYQGGGNMIGRVTFENTEYNHLPHKFEAGTPNTAGVIGLAAAIDYVQQIGYKNIVEHEQKLMNYLLEQLTQHKNIRLIGEAPERIGVISFVMENAHPHDIATILDREGVAVRAGHHCAMPLMERFKVPATVRASLGLYNNHDDIDQLATGLTAVNKILGYDYV